METYSTHETSEASRANGKISKYGTLKTEPTQERQTRARQLLSALLNGVRIERRLEPQNRVRCSLLFIIANSD